MEFALTVWWAKQSFGIYLGLQERIHCGYDAFRGYPETLPPCHSDIKQHSCGNETQGDH